MLRGQAAHTCVMALSLVMCSDIVFADQNRTGVGSRNASAGRRIASSGEMVGARLLGEGTLATVRLLDNVNQCVADSTDCVVYVVDPSEADPDVAYAGDTMVRSPLLMRVMLVPENDTARKCAAAELSPVNWLDVVERGPTIALLDAAVLDKMSRQAEATNSGYRLMWCPLGDSRSNPWGQSWRLRLLPKSVDPRRTP